MFRKVKMYLNFVVMHLWVMTYLVSQRLGQNVHIVVYHTLQRRVLRPVC